MTAAATSSGVETRPKGERASSSWMSARPVVALVRRLPISVTVRDGATMLQRIPWARSSLAMVSARASMAALAML